MDLCHIFKIIGLSHLGFRCRVSGVSSKKVRAGLKPDTRHLKPILRKGFNTPDNVQKKRAIFIVNYEVCPLVKNSYSELNPNVAKVGGLQSQGVKGEVVVVYLESLTTQDLKFSGFPAG